LVPFFFFLFFTLLFYTFFFKATQPVEKEIWGEMEEVQYESDEEESGLFFSFRPQIPLKELP